MIMALVANYLSKKYSVTNSDSCIFIEISNKSLFELMSSLLDSKNPAAHSETLFNSGLEYNKNYI